MMSLPRMDRFSFINSKALLLFAIPYHMLYGFYRIEQIHRRGIPVNGNFIGSIRRIGIGISRFGSVCS